MDVMTMLKNSLVAPIPRGASNLVKPQTAPVITTTAQPQEMPQVKRVNDDIILRRGGIFVVNDGFDNTSSAKFLALNAPETKPLVSITVPQGSDQSLLITHFANELSDIAAWTFFVWDMYIDDVPVQSYYGVLDQLGQTNLMRKVGVDILVNAGQTLKVNVRSLAGVPADYNAIVSLIGVYGTYDYNRD